MIKCLCRGPRAGPRGTFQGAQRDGPALQEEHVAAKAPEVQPLRSPIVAISFYTRECRHTGECLGLWAEKEEALGQRKAAHSCGQQSV